MNKPINPNSMAFETQGYGLTKREYLTAVALGGLLAHGDRISVAYNAVSIADRVIEELNKTSEEAQDEKV